MSPREMVSNSVKEVSRGVGRGVGGVGRAVADGVGSFHPGAWPVLTRVHYRRELAAWALLPVALGAVEGGVTAVLAKSMFEGLVSPGALALAVAILSGAPAFANITSFFWAHVSHGRHKIRFLTGLQIALAVLVLLIAAIPATSWGLLMLTACVVGGRMCWSGVVTLRSTVWRANYPRTARASLAGKLATVQALTMAGVAYLVGLALDLDGGPQSHWIGIGDPANAFRIVYALAAGGGLLGAMVYRGLRMRGHRMLLNTERAETESSSSINPLRLAAVLRDDPAFRKYTTCMMIFGTGNLMMTAPLVVMLKDRFEYSEAVSVAIVSSIPLLLMPLSIPIWSKLLDRVHIVQFRAIHSWAFVSAIAMVLVGGLLRMPAFLWIGAACQGAAFGGGVLGWNLGHLDFATPQRAGEYMGVHVTLTGLRGLIAPTAAMAIYTALEAMRPGAGPWVFAAALALSATGALMFVALAASMRRDAMQKVKVHRAPCEPGQPHASEFGESGPPVQPPSAG